MPRDKDYPVDLAKRDPLVVEPIKIPKSVLALFTAVAKRRQRFRSFVIREILIEAAGKLEVELAREEANARKLRARSAAKK